jgi:ligand-binding sensor domain-containing protein/signal transduction histidine kinase
MMEFSSRESFKSPKNSLKPTIHILVIVLLLSCFTPLLSQISGRFHRLGVEQGLAQSTVWKIAQDPYGFIWFATPDGLNRYDGYEMKTYRNDLSDTLAPFDNYFYAPFFDRRGMLWIGTSQGLAQFDPRNERIIHGKNGVHFLKQAEREKSVRTIVESQNGYLWLGTFDKGVIRFDPENGNFVEYSQKPGIAGTLPAGGVRALVDVDTQWLYVGTTRGFFQMDKETGECRIPTNLPRVLQIASITDLKMGNGGVLWIATETDGLFQYEPVQGSFKQFRSDGAHSKALTDNTVMALLIDTRGFVWAGTQKGLNLINPVDGSVSQFTHVPQDVSSLSSDVVISLYEDDSQNLWIGTQTNGVSKLDIKKPKFTIIRNRPGERPLFRQSAIWKIVDDRNGYLWIGAGELYRYNRQRRRAELIHGIERVQNLITDSRENLWVFTHHGLKRLDQKGRVVVSYQDRHVGPHAAAALRSYTVSVDKEGIIWIGSRNGHLIRFDQRSGSFQDLSPDGQPADTTMRNAVTGIAENAHGELYITRAGDMFRYSKEQNRFTRFPPEHSGNDTLRLQGALSLCMSKSNTLWIGTFRGLFSYHEPTGTWRRFTDEDGLINDKIWAILEDHHGAIWVSTNKGIIRLRETSDGNVEIRNYDGSDIATTPDFNQAAAWRSHRTGELFFGSVDGLVIFHPDSMIDNPYPPRVALTGFRKFDQETSLGQPVHLVKELTLPSTDNVFSFRFAALEFTNPSRNRYASMMEGFEDDWTYTRTRREVRYTNLPSGEYVFRVKAANNDGVWNEEGISVKVTILPPFWQTWWFIALSGIMLLGTIGGTIRYVELRKVRRHIEQLEQERAIETERSRISQDMHDEIGSSLTKIAILGELIKREAEQGNRSSVHAERITSTAREVIDNMAEIIWAIDPKNDRLENILAYIREYAAEQYEIAGITCHFDFPMELPSVKYSAKARRNMFLVVKEAVNNIIKHSGATRVEMKLTFMESAMELSIHDNGKGFDDKRDNATGHGLVNMKSRIEEIGGTFSVVSRPGNGTMITVWIRTG